MTMRIWVVILAVSLECLGQYSRHRYTFHIRSPATFMEALQDCKSEGLGVAQPHTVESFLSFANPQHLQDPLWIPMIEHQQGMWTWINGEPYHNTSSYIILHGNSSRKCAVVNVIQKSVLPIFCFEKNPGYLCYPTERKFCHKPRKCIHLGNSSLLIGNEYITWHQAHYSCQVAGGDLVSRDAINMTLLTDTLREIGANHSQYYIGLTNGWWDRADSHEHEGNYELPWKWGPGEPSSNGSCAIIYGKYHLWKAARCSEKYRYICYSKYTYKGQQTRSTPKGPMTMKPDMMDPQQTIDPGTWATATLLILGNIGLIFIHVYHKLCGQPFTHRKTPELSQVVSDGRVEDEGGPTGMEGGQHDEAMEPEESQRRTTTRNTRTKWQIFKSILPFLNLLIVFFCFHVPHIALFVLQTTLNSRLGIITTIFLHFGSWFESTLCIPILKLLNSRAFIFACVIRLAFVVCNAFPKPFTLIPFAFLLGLARTTTDTFLAAYSRRLKRVGSFLPNDPFSTNAFLLYMIPVMLGLGLSAAVLNFVPSSIMYANNTLNYNDSSSIYNILPDTHEQALPYKNNTLMCGKHFCIDSFQYWESFSMPIQPMVRYGLVGALGLFPVIATALSCFLPNDFDKNKFKARWKIRTWTMPSSNSCIGKYLWIFTVPCHLLLWYLFTVYSFTYSQMLATCYRTRSMFINITLVGMFTMYITAAVYTLIIKKCFRLPLLLKISISHIFIGAYCVMALEWNPRLHDTVVAYIHGVMVTLSRLVAMAALYEVSYTLSNDLKTKIYLLREVTVSISCTLCTFLCYHVLIYIAIRLTWCSFLGFTVLYAQRLIDQQISQYRPVTKKSTKNMLTLAVFLNTMERLSDALTGKAFRAAKKGIGMIKEHTELVAAKTK